MGMSLSRHTMYNSSYTGKILWGHMTKDIQTWVKNYKNYKTAKDPHRNPKPPQVSIVVKNHMDLLCLELMKVDLSRNGKENTLIMTNTFSSLSIAVMAPNQKANMLAKSVVDKWFCTYGILVCFHSDQGKSFDIPIIEQLCRLYSIQQSTTRLYNPCVM